jgi:hypothetical protein
LTRNRSTTLPAWVTGLAFISANLGALELMGMTANGAQYGMATVHYYWIGAISFAYLAVSRAIAALLRMTGPVPAPDHHAGPERSMRTSGM